MVEIFPRCDVHLVESAVLEGRVHRICPVCGYADRFDAPHDAPAGKKLDADGVPK